MATRKITKKPVETKRKVPTFREFYATYCALNDLEITDVHWEIVAFLEDHKNWNNRTAVLQVWRSVGKSTIVQLYAVWRLVVDPTTRIMIFSGVTARASRMAQAICDKDGGLIVTHPMSKHLYNGKTPWRADQMYASGHVILNRSAS